MTRESEPHRPEGRADPKAIFATIATIIAGILYVIFHLATDGHIYVAWLAAWSGATFFLYGFDKFQAEHGGLRVPKMVLHVLALLGAFSGDGLACSSSGTKCDRLTSGLSSSSARSSTPVWCTCLLGFCINYTRKTAEVAEK